MNNQVKEKLDKMVELESSGYGLQMWWFLKDSEFLKEAYALIDRVRKVDSAKVDKMIKENKYAEVGRRYFDNDTVITRLFTSWQRIYEMTLRKFGESITFEEITKDLAAFWLGLDDTKKKSYIEMSLYDCAQVDYYYAYEKEWD